MSSFWPEPVDYAEAVQMPRTSFSDPDLQAAAAEMGTLGPVMYSGNFASVYHLRAADGQRSWAVKCFTRQVAGQQERYQRISEHLLAANLGCAVDFQYQENGIRIRDEWFPILKMDWVNGLTLLDFVEQNIEDYRYLGRLYTIWLRLEPYLRESQTVHGDLQHGNVMLVPGQNQGKLSLRVIDYDGLWTPELADSPSGEAGHKHYQHPDRQRLQTYSPEVDRFPHLVIAAALRCLSHPNQVDLWQRYQNGDNVLFTKSDFKNPESSALLHDLWTSPIPELQSWAGLITAAAKSPLDATPRLKERVVDGKLPALPAEEMSQAREILGPQSGTITGKATELPSDTGENWWEQPLTDTDADVDEVVEVDDEEKEAVQQPVRRGRGKRASKALVRSNKSNAPGMRINRLFVGATVSIVVLSLLIGWFVINKGRRETASKDSQPTRPANSIETGHNSSETTPPLALAPFDANEARQHQATWAKHLGSPVTIENSIGMKLTLIPAGTFTMGSPASEEGRLDNEGPQHTVRISQPFYMGVYEVTQGEYEQVMGINLSNFSKTGTGSNKVSGQDTSQFPVERISWFDAIEFCNKLSEKENLSASYVLTNAQRDGGSIWLATVSEVNLAVSALGLLGYRLPTEVEWEYACRAGTTTPFHFGSVSNGEKANVNGNFPYGTTTKGPSLSRATSVGSYAANAFDLCDMHGNVYEWCFDVYDAAAYGKRSGTTPDPTVTRPGSRVLRGGSWSLNARSTRSADRDRYTPDGRSNDGGFRVVR